MTNLCREYTLPRSEEASRAERVDSRKEKHRPGLGWKVCFHQGRYGLDVMVETLFRDRTVRNVNGTNKHVTDTSEIISIGNVEQRVAV